MAYLKGRRVTLAGTLTAVDAAKGHEGDIHVVIYLKEHEPKPQSAEDLLEILHGDLADLPTLQEAAAVEVAVLDEKTALDESVVTKAAPVEEQPGDAKQQCLAIVGSLAEAQGAEAEEWKSMRLMPPKE